MPCELVVAVCHIPLSTYQLSPLARLSRLWHFSAVHLLAHLSVDLHVHNVPDAHQVLSFITEVSSSSAFLLSVVVPNAGGVLPQYPRWRTVLPRCQFYFNGEWGVKGGSL